MRASQSAHVSWQRCDTERCIHRAGGQACSQRTGYGLQQWQSWWPQRGGGGPVTPPWTLHWAVERRGKAPPLPTTSRCCLQGRYTGHAPRRRAST